MIRHATHPNDTLPVSMRNSDFARKFKACLGQAEAIDVENNASAEALICLDKMFTTLIGPEYRADHLIQECRKCYKPHVMRLSDCDRKSLGLYMISGVLLVICLCLGVALYRNRTRAG